MARTNAVKPQSKFQSALTPILWMLLGPPIAWALLVIVIVLFSEVRRAFG